MNAKKIKKHVKNIRNFFVRQGRKISRWFIRLYRKCSRFLIRLKQSKGKNIIDAICIFKRNALLTLLCDKNYFANIKEQLDQIPESNGSHYYTRYSNKIGIIADQFLYDSYKDIANFIYVTPDNYEDICDSVEFLLVVSAWRGLNNEWRQMATIGSAANAILYETISYYQESGKTVVFYSKEDPPNYNHFLPIAKRCDVIFTSALEMVDAYKKDCGHEFVYTMKFGINPLYHNPIGIRKFPKQKEVIFSGSWVKKYPDRIRDLKIIFEGVLAAGKKLKIVDRNFSLNSPAFFFPVKYNRYISPAIDHDYLQKTHKLYDWAININSVTDSRTMFANRVYELQAIGNLMLSNHSRGVEEQFEDVIIVKSGEDVKKALLSYNPEEIYFRQMAGVRRVMTGETTFDRVGEMLTTLGFKVSQPPRSVLVVMVNQSEDLINQFNSQSYPYKEYFSLDQLTENMWSQYDYIAIWDINCRYSQYYIEDMVNGFKYTDCDYICKDSFYRCDELVAGIEHDYTEHIRNIFAVIFSRESLSVHELKQLLVQENIVKANGYSIDHFNFQMLV